VETAITSLSKDFTPLTDMRATAVYRMMVAENLLRRFFMETSGAEGQKRLMREAAE
jgi:xanthine dehydrogenase small subunit